MGKVLITCLCITASFVLARAWQFRTAVKHIGNHRGLRYLFDPNGFLAAFFPWRLRFVSPGKASLLFRKYQDFKENDCDLITSVSVLPSVYTSFYLADPEALKTITANRILFPKPLDRYTALTLYGPNIVASENEEWKRYRKVSAPSFSERNNKLVWSETLRVVEEMFEEDGWNTRETGEMTDTLEATSSIALFVISAASFGKSLSWKKTDNECPAGYTMSFRDVIKLMSLVGIALKVITPDWLLKLGPTKTLRDVNTSFHELKAYMLDMIVQRRAAGMQEDYDDLFGGLLAANEEKEGEQKLSDEELIGNVWVMLIAGHETTGVTLFFVLALLAIYQDEQDAFYKQIREILPKGETPKYSDIHRYTRAQAIIYETLRVYPAVLSVFKSAAEDTVLTTHNCAGDPVNVALPKGSEILVDILAMHYHPRYWEEPEAWRPERFLGDWPRDAFMPFSTGARGCIGRRFAEVESIAVLVMIISRYELHLKPDPLYEHETPQETRKRILRPHVNLSFRPHPIPLVFKKRH